MNRISTPLTVAAYVVFGIIFASTAAAAGDAIASSDSLLDIVSPVWEAITGKHWWLASALGLVAAVTLFKKYAPAGKARDFANSDHGGAVLVLGGAFGASLAASLAGATPVPMSAELAYDALRVALTAAGGYALINKLIVGPLVASNWYQTKAPTWVKTGLGLVTWIFSKSAGAKAIAAAEKKGDAAVAANPPGGTSSVIGNPSEV